MQVSCLREPNDDVVVATRVHAWVRMITCGDPACLVNNTLCVDNLLSASLHLVRVLAERTARALSKQSWVLDPEWLARARGVCSDHTPQVGHLIDGSLGLIGCSLEPALILGLNSALGPGLVLSVAGGEAFRDDAVVLLKLDAISNVSRCCKGCCEEHCSLVKHVSFNLS